MVTTNIIEANINYDRILEKYSIFVIREAQKEGAYIFNKYKEINTLSVVYDKYTIYLLCNKNVTDTMSLKSILKEDEKLRIEEAVDLKIIKPYIILRLFLYSLANKKLSDIQLSNITGKLFLIHPSFLTNKKRLKTVKIDINYFLNISASITVFSRIDNDKNNLYLEEPKYELNENDLSLRRLINVKKGQSFYINRSFGVHKNMNYMNFQSDLYLCRNFFLIRIFKELKELTKGYIEINLKKAKCIESRESIEKKDIIDNSLKIVSKKGINVINKALISKPELDLFVDIFENKLRQRLSISNEIDEGKNNIVLVHNKEYYELNNKADEYINNKKGCNIQHIAIEDGLNEILKCNEPVINTIFKELAIKDDVLTKKIQIDEWSKYDFKNNYIFGLNDEFNIYLMIVNKNGDFMFVNNPIADALNDTKYSKLTRALIDQKGYGNKYLVADDLGNINIFRKTDIIPIANYDVYKTAVNSKLSRGKKVLNKIKGVYGINLIDMDGNMFINAGEKLPIGFSISKAPHFYSIKVIEGESIIHKIIDTFAVGFVKYNEFTVIPYPFKYLFEWRNIIK